jgi:CBS domain-containing protein
MIILERMLSAADIMTRRVFTLPASLSLEGAAWALAHRGVSGAPVLDDDGTLVGVLSEADLLETRVGDGLAGAADLDAEDGEGVGVGRASMEVVADAMTPALLAVGPGDPVSEVIALMIAHRAHRVLVLDDAGALAGIITTVDVLRELAAGRISPARDLGEPAAPALPQA